MIRVLHVLHGLSAGGITKWIVDVYRRLDPQEFDFDFACHRQLTSPYLDFLRSRGSLIFHLPDRRHFIRYAASLYKVIRTHGPYHVLHCHYHTFSVIPIFVALRLGVPVRITHLHKDNLGTSFFRLFDGKGLVNLGCILPRISTHGIACSRRAADAVWGSSWAKNPSFLVMPCGIDTERFRALDRNKARNFLRVEHDSLLFLHVGNFSADKNYIFLLQLFLEILSRRSKAQLLLVGDGKLRREIESLGNSLGLNDHARFLGFRTDIPELLKAADALLLPSILEGFPIVAVEAQFAQIPVVASTRVTREIDLFGNVLFLDLEAGPAAWAEKILEFLAQPRTWPPLSDPKYVRLTLDENIRILTRIYQQALANERRFNTCCPTDKAG